MELQEPLLVAAAAGGADECTPSSVALPHRPLDLCGDVARAGNLRWGLFVDPLPGAIRGGMLLLSQLLQKHGQSPIEDRRRIAIGDLVAQERLRPPQLLMRFGARRELDFVALRRERLDHRPACGRNWRQRLNVSRRNA